MKPLARCWHHVKHSKVAFAHILEAHVQLVVCLWRARHRGCPWESSRHPSWGPIRATLWSLLSIYDLKSPTPPSPTRLFPSLLVCHLLDWTLGSDTFPTRRSLRHSSRGVVSRERFTTTGFWLLTPRDKADLCSHWFWGTRTRSHQIAPWFDRNTDWVEVQHQTYFPVRYDCDYLQRYNTLFFPYPIWFRSSSQSRLRIPSVDENRTKKYFSFRVFFSSAFRLWNALP